MKFPVTTIIKVLSISTSLLYSNTSSIFDKPEKKDPIKTLQDAQRDYSHIKDIYDQAYAAYKESKDNAESTDLRDRLRSEKCSVQFTEFKHQKGLCVSTRTWAACTGASLAHEDFKACIEEGVEKAKNHEQECKTKLDALKEQLFETSQKLTKARQEEYATHTDNPTTLKKTVPSTNSPSPSLLIQPSTSTTLSTQYDADSYIHHHVTTPILTLTTTQTELEKK